MGPPAAYPSELEREVVLKDGSRLRIRPIREDDALRLITLYERLSAHTAYQRFFTVMRRLPPDWARLLATVDYWRRLALVAEGGSAEAPELIAVARYEPTDHEDTVEGWPSSSKMAGRGRASAPGSFTTWSRRPRSAA